MPASEIFEQRDVLVIMPFGGEDNIENRRSVLNFKRLQHVIELCEVDNVDSHSRVSYSVNACKVNNADDINDTILERIRNADVVVALFNSSSPTVVYEAAVRHLLRDGLILVVDTAQKDYLPFYLHGLGYCSWNHPSARPVLDRIDRIAEDKEISGLDDFFADIPEDLRRVIDRDDTKLRAELENALGRIEVSGLRPRPAFVRAVAGGMLGGVITDRMTTLYAPTSVVAVAFRNPNEFDAHRRPFVCEYNERFARLYGYVDKKAAELYTLTAEVLLNRLERNDLIENYAEFVREQGELQQEIIEDKGFRWASVTMKTGPGHPFPDFRNRELLPCVVARQTVGNVNGRHTMYILVVYIDVTDLSNQVKDEVRETQHEAI